MTMYVLDTHLLVWALTDDKRLSPKARAIINDTDNRLAYSVASLWEVAIKGPQRMGVDAAKMRSTLAGIGYLEIPIQADHVIAVADLPRIHGDPFDRLLVGLIRSGYGDATLLTHDATVSAYGGRILLV